MIRFLKFTSFLMLIPILAGIGMSSCSMTKSVVRQEKIEKVPVVTSGPVEWSDEIDLRAVPADEVITDDGTGVFEIEAGAGPAAPDPAKVTFRYRLRYTPKEKIEMSIDSAMVETQKEIKTVTSSEKIVIEKKIYKILFIISIGSILTLTAILALSKIRIGK